MTQIPPRSTSKYAGQYAGTLGAQRLAEIFADSYKIALSSKNPDTANDRFDLAVEAYYQFMTMESSDQARLAVHRAMEELVEFFPIQVLANQALGLREKAQKLRHRGNDLTFFEKQAKSSTVVLLNIQLAQSFNRQQPSYKHKLLSLKRAFRSVSELKSLSNSL